MANRLRYAKFQENLFSNNEIKLIFCPPLFRKQPIKVIYIKIHGPILLLALKQPYKHISGKTVKYSWMALASKGRITLQE